MAEVEDQEYPLHECIFNGDLKRLSALLRLHDISKKDKHGKILFLHVPKGVPLEKYTTFLIL